MKGFTSIAGIRYYNGIKTSDFIGKRNRCKHGLLNSQPCSLCLNTRKVFSKPCPGEHYDYESKETTYTTESFDIVQKAVTHESDIFNSWDSGEAGLGTLLHSAKLSQADRFIFETCHNGLDKVNRLEPRFNAQVKPQIVWKWFITSKRSQAMINVPVKETFPLTSDVINWSEKLTYTQDPLRMKRITKLDTPLNIQLSGILESFSLNENDKFKMLGQTKTSAKLIELEQMMLSMEAIQDTIYDRYVESYPFNGNKKPVYDSEEEEEEEEEETREYVPPELVARSIGYAAGDDFITSGGRSETFKTWFKRIVSAKQKNDCKALSVIGQTMRDVKLSFNESNALWYLYHVAKDRLAWNNRYKFQAVFRYIDNASQSVWEELKSLKKGIPLGKIGNPTFTSEQWTMLFDHCKQRFPLTVNPPIDSYEQEVF